MNRPPPLIQPDGAQDPDHLPGPDRPSGLPGVFPSALPGPAAGLLQSPAAQPGELLVRVGGVDHVGEGLHLVGGQEGDNGEAGSQILIETGERMSFFRLSSRRKSRHTSNRAR